MNNNLINKYTGGRIEMTAVNLRSIFKTPSPVERAAKELANKMLVNNLLTELAESKVASTPANNNTIDLFEIKQKVNDMHIVITQKSLQVEKVSLSHKEKITNKVEEIRAQRMLKAVIEKN